MDSNVSCTSTMEPTTVSATLTDDHWILAMQEELLKFEGNQVWDLIPKPPHANIIGTKWILKNKTDEQRRAKAKCIPVAAHLKMTKDTTGKKVDPRVCASYQADARTYHVHSAKRIMKLGAQIIVRVLLESYMSLHTMVVATHFKSYQSISVPSIYCSSMAIDSSSTAPSPLKNALYAKECTCRYFFWPFASSSIPRSRVFIATLILDPDSASSDGDDSIVLSKLLQLFKIGDRFSPSSTSAPAAQGICSSPRDISPPQNVPPQTANRDESGEDTDEDYVPESEKTHVPKESIVLVDDPTLSRDNRTPKPQIN
ncbi:putative mitochondrial protein [Cucumis melo var. makuwa]|uniref:Mitochondrial protein n=1 Tax=Cucumis melo var. makuwa TaxID=1194695 RepID=A0A5A7SRV0_CUCMM|nr:putative mitochondrial protein [Cucumis melo var. makuwa]TYK16820.1 putative mitochondrial protein [Cucumis melo var. makuwa]